MKKYNKKIKLNLKKSQLCLLGSLLAISGIILLSFDHIRELRNQVFAMMELSLIDNSNDIDTIVEDIPEVEKVDNNDEQVKETKRIDYSVYTGILEIPKISLKRGFYSPGHRYNNIEKNVTVINGSNMPDEVNGNLILAAHSGDAYISYFAYLYKLQIGDLVYVTYNNIKYKYQIVNIYNVPKVGSVTITRNLERTTLTMITCTKNSDTEQTVYIAEQI